MDLRSLAFRTDLALLRLAGSEVEDLGTHVAVRTPANPTFRWGNFHLLPRPPRPDEVEEVLARYDADFPEARHRTFGVDGTEDQRDALAGLVAAGLTADPATVMTADSVRRPPRPHEGAVLRQLRSDEDWAQRVEVSVATELAGDGLDDEAAYRTFATRRAAADRALCEAGHGTWWGAFVDGRLGSVMGLVDAGDGLARYQTVETHPDLRGRGLAGTLVHRVAQHGFEVLGARTLVMVADPGYLAIRVYRSVGFEDTETQTLLEQRQRPAG